MKTTLTFRLWAIWQRLKLRLWLQDGPLHADEWFSLKVGSEYQVLRSVGALTIGSYVRYLGSYREPADRGWDTFHQFESRSGEQLILPDAQAPRSVLDSYRLFADVPHPNRDCWDNPDLMQALHHRARGIRFAAVNTVDSQTKGLHQALPILFEQCMRESGENPYLEALVRIRADWLSKVEQLCASEGHSRYAELVLARMGSRHYLNRYLEDLTAADQHTARHAAKRLADIGDPTAIPVLEQLSEHPHLNVRFAVRDALKRLRQ